MLKITKTQESAGDVLLTLEGKVTDQWAALLDGICRGYLREKKDVQLDCAQVDFVDARGVEVLQMFPRKHVSLLNVPGFVTQLLKTGGRSCMHTP
jgi:ABC-type transporter Mla MlaB component